MTIPHDEINESIKAKIQTLKNVANITSTLEARQHELESYDDTNNPLQNIDCRVIIGTAAKDKLQIMIRSAAIKKHEEILAEIDSSPEEAIEYFEFRALSDADKTTFRNEYKKSLAELNKKDQDEITNLTGVKFE